MDQVSDQFQNLPCVKIYTQPLKEKANFIMTVILDVAPCSLVEIYLCFSAASSIRAMSKVVIVGFLGCNAG